MSSSTGRIPASVGQPLRLAAWVFCLGIAFSGLLLRWQSQRNEAIAQQAFADVAARTTDQLRRRLSTYEYGLRGARGAAISAGIDQINRQRFRDYSKSRDIDREFPGARGMGLIRRVQEADVPRFIELARRDGAPDFSIRMLTPHQGEHYVIQYIEPIERNRAAIGLDIASESRRLAAAKSSMRSGTATLTAPITLVQATGKQRRSLLLLLPIYAPGAALSPPEVRADFVVGWSYAPLIMDEVLADFELGDRFSLALNDTEQPEGETFFKTPGPVQPPALGLSRRVPFPIYGRTWRLELKATPSFVTGLNLLSPRTVGGLGVVIATLLGVLTFSYAQSRQRQAQVRAEQTRRAAIVDSSNDAIIGETLDGIITDWNHGAELLFGYRHDEAVGKTAASLILTPDRANEDAELCNAIRRGASVPTFDSTRRRADGSTVEVSVTVAAIEASNGRRIGLSKTIRDISAAKRAAREIAALNANLERQVLERTALLGAAQRDLRNILDAVPSLVSYWDRDFRNRFANRAYREWLGWDPAEMPGKLLQEIAGEGYEGAAPRMQAALRGEPVVFETTVPTREGGVRDAVAHYLPDVVGDEVQGFYVIVYDVTAQTKAKAELATALRDNEALLRTINEHAIVSVTDRTGRIVEVNERFCAISGYTRAELLDQDHRLLNSRTHDPDFWPQVWQTIASGQPWRGEICNRRKDGSLYWVDSILAPFKGADGQIEKYISIRFDITQAKLNEKNLQQTKDRIAMAADGAGIGIWEWDIRENVLTWDDWMYRLYGQPATVNQQPYTLWSSSLHADDRERAERELNAAISGERPFDTEFRIFRADGQLRHLKASARVIRDSNGQPLRMTGVNFDITERKRAELELLETSSLLKSVLEAASEVAIIAGDPSLTLQVFNPGAERLLGYRAAELIGKATPMIFHDAAEVSARAAELTALTSQPVIGGEAFVHPLALRQPRDWTYIRKDGTRVTVSLVVTPMYGKDGEIFGYLGVAHDVTQQKQYESTLRRAMREAEQANRAKSQFLANMSHEIRTPLNAVVGLTHLLEQTKLDRDQASFLAKIHTASTSLLALLNDVLDVSKIEAGELALEQTHFDLATLVADISGLALVQCQAKGLRFVADVPALPHGVEGDVTRLTQILNNLVSNAIKFTEKGSVTLRVRESSRSDESIVLRFEVEDTGLGIPSHVQPRLFAPFAQADASTTRRFGGTGLGLSIVKRLAELMGGEVGLQSEPGRGSTFSVTVSLKLAAPMTLSQPSSADCENDGLAGVRVLVADDSEINLFVAQRILRNAGASVTLATNGDEAVALVKTHSFDVVLMDAHMPVMDGFGATQVIRRELGITSLPIIALTADARATERQRALNAEMNDFLTKPFQPQELIRTIQKVIKAAAAISPATTKCRPNGAEPWPQLDGIDTRQVQQLLAGDEELFRELLLRLFEEFTDVAAPADLEHASVRTTYAARMHKLKGASGQIGARSISALAGRIEAACIRDETREVPELASALGLQLTALRVAAQSVGEPGQFAETATALTSSPPKLGRILTLLRAQNLAVLSEARELYPWARATWNPARCESFVAHIESLRFADAAALLEMHLPTSA